MTTNGGEEIQLPDHRQRIVDAANSAYQKALNDIEELERKYREALIRIDGQQVQLEAMHGVHNMMESSIASHRLERDQAVTRAAKLEAILENVMIVVHSGLKKKGAAVMYVHKIDKDTQRIVVGYFIRESDGSPTWMPMSSFESFNQAARFINYLNGGNGANANIVEAIGDDE